MYVTRYYMENRIFLPRHSLCECFLTCESCSFSIETAGYLTMDRVRAGFKMMKEFCG